MLEIKIICEPSELAEHLFALQGRPLTQALPAQHAVFYPPPEPEGKPSRLAREADEPKAEAHEPSRLAREAEEPKAEAHEPAKRRGRPPKSDTVHVDPPAPEPEKPLIASGEERVNPQDTADEKAETEAKTTKGLTVEDVRRKVKAYGDHFGHEAAMTDIRPLIGCSISELKTDYDSLLKAIVAISDAIFHNQRPGGASPAKPVPEAKVEAVVEPKIEPESLFGGVVKAPEPPPAPRATPDEVNAAGRAYCDLYDGKGKPFKECVNFLADVSSMVTKLFGEKIKTLRDIDGLPGERELHYGRLRAEILAAVESNPYGRTRV